MSKPFRFGSTISLVAVASMIAGCAAPQARVQTSSGAGTGEEVGLATRALAALNANDLPAAINYGERAVAKTPGDARLRTLLGNAYFASGRFWSAEAAYKDSLSIHSNQPQVILKLALVEIGLGKTGEALAFLEAGRAVLAPADYGLALALAGQAAEAVPVLEAAARARGADARARQNLALAYAFAGDWTNARTVAAQDVPANQLDSRIQQWMQMAKPGRPADKVAALVGVTPANIDPGQPVRLALHKPDARLAQVAPAPVRVAQPQPRPQPQVVRAAPAPVAAPQPAVVFAAPVTPPPPPLAFAPAAAPPPPRRVAAAPAPAFEPVPAPEFTPAPPVAEAPVVAPPPAPKPQRVVIRAPETLPAPMALVAAAAQHAPAMLAAIAPKVVPSVAKPAKVRRASAPKQHAPVRHAALRRGNSNAVVQLGAYRSPQWVASAWNVVARRYGMLRAYKPMSARFVDGRGTFYRLSVKGFASDREARLVCESLRRSGGSCFVRNVAGDAPVQIASR